MNFFHINLFFNIKMLIGFLLIKLFNIINNDTIILLIDKDISNSSNIIITKSFYYIYLIIQYKYNQVIKILF